MGDDDYTVAGGKGLRLKGAKVKKNKKKKTEGSKAADKVTELDKALSADKRSDKDADAADGDDEQAPARQDEEYAPLRRKTETERRFEEAKRKKLLEMAQSAAAKPELLKTHKERVEELNTYLSKLSEHHDMPKIGPG
ncbi:hypothetical protein MCOR27_011181 [Pyricularia oryzae]|uniref:DUF1754-domain-containing protein n=5 Tax=Pyricularia TaxID=48558 RepID=A0ABQ8NCV2_PYRGI|nr:uncharacterized protein MGG_09476 [Pyricularia oryzae 70-15]ELQ39238.1 hypothetical protein OOU_Y34scaffold00511g28 [Pyricularia oryzae Y34]KAH8847677.1 hypothetical protein MCOR01_001086 [Pyricularia oryzae]KAI6295013.1 hypothetical protein MCOR33_008015 [Pyricularia grisea]EHA52466.1 hypothetical protein MGG_09476 [Pyricularia oryzae 70-15]KAH9430394.1 hypothetical protein MCOR02_010099 [Pyricularia oryzae]